MQTLTAAPRDHLTTAQVAALLHASNLSVDFGADLLDTNLAYLDDLSADVSGGSVDWSLHASIHRTCRLQLSRELAWGNVLVRPWMELSDGATTARWWVGVYAPTTPERAWSGARSGVAATQPGQEPITDTTGEPILDADGYYITVESGIEVLDPPEFKAWEVDGYDRLYLMAREVGADYTVAAGVTYRQALLDVFSAAGLSGVVIDGSAADDVLPAAKSWPLVTEDTGDPDQTDTPVTWLRIVNDLLRAINFRSCWCDEQGRFRCQAYQPPTQAAPEWIFDADDEHLTILGEERRMSEDVWKVPNRWVFRWTNGGTGVEGDGIYTVDESDTVNGDWLGRTLVWTSVVDYEAASQAKLVSLGDRRVADDKRVTTMFDVTTGPFPGADHADVFTYRDVALGERKVQARSWSLPLDGGEMAWSWEGV